MRVIFCRANDPISFAIRLATWSPWSHVGLVDGTRVIEAWFPYVRVSKLADVIRHHSAVAYRDIYCASPSKALDAAMSQVGKPYDLKGVMGLPFGRNWQDDDYWWCSELVAWSILQGGTRLFPDVHRVTPGMLWQLT